MAGTCAKTVEAHPPFEKPLVRASLTDLHKAFQCIRGQLDKFIIGQADIKEALILALIAQEHIFLQGEPGCAKTLLAEVAGNAANLKFQYCQLHRDTRLSELVGDIVLERTPMPGGAEVISQKIQPGGLLTADVALLDDITRAPGEALSVLLRVLNERQFQREKIPLLTAIATSNPTVDDYYNEPLDPANLDRFTIQIRSAGLLQENQWEQVAELIDLYSTSRFSEEIRPEPILDREVFDNAYEVLHHVEVTDLVKRGLMDILSRFVNQFKLDQSNSLITDRSFLVKTIKILRANALLAGRMVVALEDLHSLTFLTTFRVPEEINRSMPELVNETIQRVAE